MSILGKVISSVSRNSWNSFFGLLLFITPVQAAEQAVHAIALHGAPKYAADFAHLDYVNPDAPKGGSITVGVVGSFDSLNPFIVKGLPAAGSNLVYETLLDKSLDEPLTSYGLLAENMIMPDDRSWIVFNLRKEAKWQDGQAVTPDDVIWTFQTLMKEGQPFYRSYYGMVDRVEKSGANRVKFVFKEANNRELPLIVGDMPVLPKHFWKGKDFSKTSLTPGLGSGPYRVKSVNAGRQIVYERQGDWWGRDLPLNKGRYNFDRIAYDYYRDPGVAFQAFLGGAIDFRQENIAKNWAQGYNHPAVTDGRIKKESFKHQLPTGMQAFVYNTRRKQFSDPLVREALGYAFDFEWSNKQMAFDSYVRTQSYFSNSDLAVTALPDEAELKLLEPLRGQIPPRVFTEVYAPPRTSGNGDNRANLRKAIELLRQAGWTTRDGVLRNKAGEAFSFEIVVDSPMFDRWVLPFIGNLKKLGITAKIRTLDAAQYQNRMNDYDFDMTVHSFAQSLTPGNEQVAFWGAENADAPGGMNLAGIKNPAIDRLIPNITLAKTRDDLRTAVRALDRVLQWNFYVIPQWHTEQFRMAYWSRLQRPDNNPPYGLPVLESWWAMPDKK